MICTYTVFTPQNVPLFSTFDFKSCVGIFNEQVITLGRLDTIDDFLGTGKHFFQKPTLQY